MIAAVAAAANGIIALVANQSQKKPAAKAKAERDAATLARWIVANRPKEIQGRALQRDVRLPGLSDAESIRAAAAVLEGDGWFLPGAKPPGAGRPRVAWTINPALWGVVP